MQSGYVPLSLVVGVGSAHATDRTATVMPNVWATRRDTIVTAPLP